MHGLIFETSVCYWQNQPGYYLQDFRLLKSHCVSTLRSDRRALIWLHILASAFSHYWMHQVQLFMKKSPNPFVHGSVYYDCLTRFIFHQHGADFWTRSHLPPRRRSKRRNSKLKGRSIVRRRMAKQPRRTLFDHHQASEMLSESKGWVLLFQRCLSALIPEGILR